MNIFHSYFIYLLLIKIISSNNKIYRIPFGLFYNKTSKFDSDIMYNIIQNRIYLNLSIGTPSQILPFELDINSQTFCVSNELFNKNNSLTYEDLSNKQIYYSYEDSEKGFNSKDILNINNNNNNKINFILGTKFKTNKKNNLGIIGLRIPKRVQFGVYPFFHSLKQAKIIDSFTWTLKYYDNISLYDQIIYDINKNNIIGEFIFGDEPYNYENNKLKYNENEFRKVTPLSTKEIIYWDIEFNNIYLTLNEYKNKSKFYFSGGKYAEIIINYSFILGPSLFLDFLEKHFFSAYMSKDICYRKTLDFYYYHIECEYNSTFKIESFPNISFEHIELETTFNLTYKDLFIIDKKKNKYIFLILTKDYFTEWVLGTTFLRKFQFVYNNDLKTIGYYKPIKNNIKENLKVINNTKTSKIIVIIILIIIFSFLLIFIGMIIQKKYFNKNRKIRANELEENFSYDSKNRDAEKFEISNDKKIIKEDIEKNTYFNL